MTRSCIEFSTIFSSSLAKILFVNCDKQVVRILLQQTIRLLETTPGKFCMGVTETQCAKFASRFFSKSLLLRHISVLTLVGHYNGCHHCSNIFRCSYVFQTPMQFFFTVLILFRLLLQAIVRLFSKRRHDKLTLFKKKVSTLKLHSCTQKPYYLSIKQN